MVLLFCNREDMTLIRAGIAVTHEPVGNPAGPGLWHHKGLQLPAYIQHIANDLREGGMETSRAIATAVSRCKVWCAGGKNVQPETRAKACLAIAEWEKLKGEAHLSKASAVAKFNPEQPRDPHSGKWIKVGGELSKVTKDVTDTGRRSHLSPPKPKGEPVHHPHPRPRKPKGPRKADLSALNDQHHVYTPEQMKAVQDRVDALEKKLREGEAKEKKFGGHEVAIEGLAVLAAIALAFVTGGASLAVLGALLIERSPDFMRVAAHYVEHRKSHYGQLPKVKVPVPVPVKRRKAAAADPAAELADWLTTQLTDQGADEAAARALADQVVSAAKASLAAGRKPWEDGFVTPEQVRSIAGPDATAAFEAAFWDPTKHPRKPKGPGGGEFAPGSTGAPPTKQNPLGNGNASPKVKQLQQRLAKLGYGVKADGIFGPKTEAAVRAFQQNNKIVVDGLVGPQTTAALRNPHAVRSKGTPKPKGISRRKTHASEDGRLMTIPDVDLMAAGTWKLASGRQTFTRQDITDAIDAAKCPAVGNPVIKIGHTDDRFIPGDGEPALGSITNLRQGSLGITLRGDFTDVPTWLGEIMASAYPRRSIEGSYDFTCQIGHKHPFVISALALLGITRPGVGVLQNIGDLQRRFAPQAAAAERPWSVTYEEGEAVVPVTEEDVRRAYYAGADIPKTWWITELQMNPAQLVVSDGEGRIYRVPFELSEGEDAIRFGEADELESYAQLAAARASAEPLFVYASADESRDVEGLDDEDDYDDEGDYDPDENIDAEIEAASDTQHSGWVRQDGNWIYDPDGDGDDDSSPEGDTDNSHWDGGKLRKGITIPPVPRDMADAAAGDSKPYGDVKYADAKNSKYPVNTKERAVAAWRYINKAKNAEVYPLNGVTLEEVKAAIMAACKRFGVQVTAEGALTDVSDDAPGSKEQPAATGTVHEPMTGKHSHAHAAYGSQGSDETHTHQHSHSGDAVHRHAHATAGAGNQKGASDVKLGNTEFTEEQIAAARARLGLADDVELTPQALIDGIGKRVAASVPQGVVQVDQERWDALNERVKNAEAFQTRQKIAERDSVIDKAIRDGKFSAARKPHYQRVWDADPEGAREIIAGLHKNVVPVADIGTPAGDEYDLLEDEYKSLFPPGTVH